MHSEINNGSRAFRVEYILLLAVTLLSLLFIVGCGSSVNQNSQNQNSLSKTSEANTPCEEGYKCECSGNANTGNGNLQNSSQCPPGCCVKIRADKPILITGGSFELEAVGLTEAFDDTNYWELSSPNEYTYRNPGRIKEVIIGVGFNVGCPDIYKREDFIEYERKPNPTGNVKVSFVHGGKENWISNSPNNALILHSDKKFKDYDIKLPKRLKDKGPDVNKIILTYDNQNVPFDLDNNHKDKFKVLIIYESQ